MLFESTYRRRAMNRLQEERHELKKDLNTRVKMERKRTKDPVKYIIMIIIGWFTQQ